MSSYNASKWQMGFNSAFKGLIVMRAIKPLLVAGSKEVAEGSGLPGCCSVSLH